MKKENTLEEILDVNATEQPIKVLPPDNQPMIYKALSNVMADMSAITKDNTNKDQGYKYRGIDQLYNALQPALTKNGVIIIPNLLDMTQDERISKSGAKSIHTKVKVEFTFVAQDGSFIKSIFPGENIDFSDKSINKAMTSAYKYCLFETLCIPTEEMMDADNESPEVGEKQEVKGEVFQKDRANEPINKEEIEKVLNECTKAGVSVDWLLGKYNKKKLEDFTYTEYVVLFNNFDRMVEIAKKEQEEKTEQISIDEL